MEKTIELEIELIKREKPEHKHNLHDLVAKIGNFDGTREIAGIVKRI